MSNRVVSRLLGEGVPALGHLGELLHQRRTSLGLTLEDLQNRTKIRGKYLEAIERGDFDVIPGDVYLRGFIRSIAGELGIDPGEAMQAYYQDLGQQATLAEEPKAPEEKPPARPIAAKTEEQPRRPRSESRVRRNLLPAMVAFGLIIVIVAGAWYWSTYLRSPKTPVVEPPIVNQSPGGTENQQPPAKPIVEVTLQNPGETSPSYLVKPGPLQVTLTAEGGRCWISIVSDGQSQQTTLDPRSPETTTISVQANQQVTFQAGNPAVLHLVINGKDQGIIGGQVPRNISIHVSPTP